MTEQVKQEGLVEQSEKRLRRNLGLILSVSFFQVFSLIMPVIVPIFESRGLSLSEILVLQAIFGFAVAGLEVPSGYFSDLVGRKCTLLVGSAFYGIAALLLCFSDGFGMLVLFELCMAIAVSFISGADLALLYDTELAIGGLEGKRPKAVRRLFMLNTLSEALAGILAGVLLAVGSLDALIGVQAALAWIPLFVCVGIYEPSRPKLSTRNHMKNFSLILRLLLTYSPVLRYAFLSLAFWSLTVFFVVWLLQKQWQLQQIPLEYFGYLWAVLTLVSSAGGQVAHHLKKFTPLETRLGFVALAPVIGYLVFASFGPVVGFFGAIGIFAARGVGIVLLRDAVNSRIPSEIRATANSLASFGFRIAFALVGPVVGFAFEVGGMRVTWLLVAGGSLLLNLGLILPFYHAIKSHRHKPTRQLHLDLIERHQRRLARSSIQEASAEEALAQRQ